MPPHQPDIRLWDVLGLTNQIRELLDGLLSGAIKTALVSGPPGSGKTWIARSIAASFVENGGAAFRGVGDDGEASRRLYALQRAQAETTGYFKPAATAGKALANVATKIATGGMLDAQGVFEAFDAEAARRKRSSLFLAEDEQSILADFSKDAGTRPVLLVADNLHWWDRDSLNLLRTMLLGKIRKAYPFLSSLRVVAVTTDETYQRPIWQETYESHIIPLFKHRVVTKYVNRQQLNSVADAIGLPDTVSPADREFIFDISGGHLTILTGACKYLAQQDSDLETLQQKDGDRFVEDLFLERLRRIGTLREIAEDLLNAAAIIGGTVPHDELQCVLKNEYNQVRAAIEVCRKLEFIDEADDRIEFRHHYIKRFFSSRLGSREVSLRLVFSECLQTLTPGDYLRRADNFLRAKEPKRAADLYVAAATANIRNGREADYLIDPNGQELLGSTGYVALLDALTEAYGCIADGRNEDASRVIEGLAPAYPPIILAEIEYLRSLADLHSRSGRRRHQLIARLDGWADHIHVEFEQGLRLSLVLRSALVLEVDKTRARNVESDLIHQLSERIYFDKSAESRIHALSRSAESLYLPDIALRRVDNAERYHRPVNGQLPSEPAEYFRCLNNLTALCISNGEYERAIKVAKQAIALADQFEAVVFPRRDMIHTLDIMARFRQGLLNASEAIELQTQAIELHGVESDPYYPQNHLGVYHCLSGRTDTGVAIFEKLRASLLYIDDPEPNVLYFISSNLCGARYLLGKSAEECILIWNDLENLVNRIAYETRILLQRRHQIMNRIFEAKLSLSPADWDQYPLRAEDRPLHPCWEEVGRGFRMPDIQFWSMY